MSLDIDNMSDEDFAKLSEADVMTSTSEATETSTETQVEDKNEVIEETINEDQSQGKTESTDESTDAVDDAGDKTEDTSKVEDIKSTEEVDKAAKPAAEEKKDEPKQAEPATAEAELAKLLAPFKANGRDMQVQNVDEALALMKMGAGFNKKMAGLKRAQKIEKLLDDHEIDEGRLSFLIDVSKNKPEALSKLIQESGIDALDLGIEVAEKYTPSVHSVTDKELALDEVLKELQSSPTVGRTLNVVTKEWDKASRDAIADDPETLKVIDEHVSNGVYDLISTQMEIDRALGKLKGLSNIQAYQQVGDTLNKQGKFAHIYGSSKDSQQTSTVPPVVVQPKLKQAEDDEQRTARRKAASGTPPAASVTKPALTKSLLDMSPEEFAKFKPNFN